MARKIIFEVHGKPQPAGSKRAFIIKGRAIVTDANKNSRDWKNQVSDSAALAYKGELMTGPVSLTVVFAMPRPKSHFTSKGKPSSQWRERPTVKPDATKLLRGVEDAITGIVWRDDSQIVCQHVYKQYGDKFLTTVAIEELTECHASTSTPQPGDTSSTQKITASKRIASTVKRRTTKGTCMKS